MRHGSLFSGIGGFDLAAEWMGWENMFQVEWDKYCQKILVKNFPKVKRYGDIKEFNGSEYRGAVDVLSGGFPCQPFSLAGERKGKGDNRHLWPEYLRIIREIKPVYVIGENVFGIISMELDNIINDLEGQNYTTEQFIIPACAVGTIHRRDRVWIIAYTNERRLQRPLQGLEQTSRIYKEPPNQFSTLNAIKWKIPIRNYGDIREGNGIPSWMDRIGSLGNSIVPQVAYQIFKAIEEYENRDITN